MANALSNLLATLPNNPLSTDRATRASQAKTRVHSFEDGEEEDQTRTGGTLTVESLRSVPALRRWVEADSRRPDAKVNRSEGCWRNVLAAAYHCTRPGVADPLSLFKHIVFGKRWYLLNDCDDDGAAAMLRGPQRLNDCPDADARPLAVIFPEMRHG